MTTEEKKTQKICFLFLGSIKAYMQLFIMSHEFIGYAINIQYN